MACNSCSQMKLRKLFEKLGTIVGRHPIWIIIAVMICTFGCSLGFFRSRYISDFDYLMTPIGCRAYEEERTLQELFPINTSSNFDIYRALHRGRFGTIIALPKDGKTILRKLIFSEIAELNKMVFSITLKVENNIYNYSDLCARKYGSCWANDILLLNNKIRQVETRKIHIKFPLELNLGVDFVNIGLFLGGVTTDENNNVLEGKAIRLLYFLDNSNSEKDNLALKWEEEFLKIISKYESDLLTIHYFASSSIDVEVWKFSEHALNFGWISYTIIVVFCIATSMTRNWVRSKPWLGLCGCISVGLAVITSFGTMMVVGVGYVALNIGVPFLLMGIGVDDTFVLIAAWRTTNPEDSVEKRMGKAYSKAAISISMTSLTNFVSFLVGMITPLPALRIFCAYCAVAVLFDFAYQVTFFGACMALDGYREHSHMHPITFRPVDTREEATNRGRLYRMLFTDKSKMNMDQPPLLMIWCRDILGNVIGKLHIRIAILVAFFLYLGGAAWNLAMLREGIEYKDLFPYNSYASSYAFSYYRYFTHYPHQIQVVFNISMDYSDPKIQARVLNSLAKFHELPFIEDIEINWLTFYLDLIHHKDSWIHRRAYNFSDPEDFVGFLRHIFLRHSTARQFEQDIIFDNNSVNISASRFVIFSKDISESSQEKDLVIKLRSLADSFSFPVTLQNIWWKNYEQLLILQRVAIQSIAIASMTTMIVFSLFLPHLSSVFCVALVIASIEFGAVGYMAALGITLNGISTVILIMSTGFCIDYSAHISYSYMVAEGSFKERIKQALFAAAMPIMQASCSTIFGVITLSIVPSFILHTFSTIIFLIILIAFLHALFVLPIFLSLWDLIHDASSRTMIKNQRFKQEQMPMNDGTTEPVT